MSNKIISNTKKNIKRNKWLSVSTILVTSIVIAISSLFISMAIIAKKGVQYYEKKAQVIVFFKKDTEESYIMLFRDKIYDENLVESIDYISQEKALEIYKEDFADNPDLLSTVTADSLPPSLEIRAKSVDSLLQIIEKINTEKETNPAIDEVMYFEDVVDNLKSLSKIINISSVVLIVVLVVITFFLIRITIGFNINSHKEEIRIMNLVGGSNSFIKLPFILEGLFYGIVGGIIGASLIMIPWYILMHYTEGTDFAVFITETLKSFDLDFLMRADLLFLLIYYAIHIIVGGIIGVISSLSAVRKYLD
ncbi:MAG TPA: permease-like cell division protein FtsX [Candidatus Dojkabacteria bacterium]|nr:permease-like cell division protein FtsX [Candidatus Dojkabacteria bacterium]